MKLTNEDYSKMQMALGKMADYINTQLHKGSMKYIAISDVHELEKLCEDLRTISCLCNNIQNSSDNSTTELLHVLSKIRSEIMYLYYKFNNKIYNSRNFTSLQYKETKEDIAQLCLWIHSIYDALAKGELSSLDLDYI